MVNREFTGVFNGILKIADLSLSFVVDKADMIKNLNSCRLFISSWSFSSRPSNLTGQ